MLLLARELPRTPHGALAYDDFGNHVAGANNGTMGVSLARAAGPGDLVAVRARSAFPARTELPQMRADYSLSVGARGSRLMAWHQRLDLRMGGEVTSLGIRTRDLSGGVSLLVPLTRGLTASSALPVPQQFNLGGADSVRGYREAEYLGDHGYLLSAELRVPLGKRESPWQAALFVDHGSAGLRQPRRREVRVRRLSGAGLRADLGRGAWMRVDVAWPLSPPIPGEARRPVLYTQLGTGF